MWIVKEIHDAYIRSLVSLKFSFGTLFLFKLFQKSRLFLNQCTVNRGSAYAILKLHFSRVDGTIPRKKYMTLTYIYNVPGNRIQIIHQKVLLKMTAKGER